MFFFLVNYSRPNITNATRELPKAHDGANPAFKELLCVIRCVLDMQNLGLKDTTDNASKPWEIVCFGDSDYVGGPVRRSSTS